MSACRPTPFLLMFWLASCGPPSTVTVTIAPSTVTLSAGATQLFSATVTGTTNTSVSWQASGGFVDQEGVFTAPQMAGAYSVSAVSQADPKRSATAAVTVEPPVDDPGSLGGTAGWERANTVMYHVWVSAFRAALPDGGSAGPATDNTGTLAGITDAIGSGYFTRLGINAIWLSPIFKATSLVPSSGNKHGYDVEDYDTVSPLYGDKAGLAALLRAAHAKGFRVLFDFVPNHTSSRHPWFQAAQSSTSTWRAWYVWASQPQPWPDNGQGWWSASGASYYGFFDPGMPDLNYRTPEVATAMTDVAKHWLDFGFDGMRVDAARHLFEGTTSSSFADQPETHAYFDALRTQLDAYPATQARMMMAESWTGDLSTILTYVKNGSTPEFNVALDFIWPGALASALADGVAPAQAVATVASHLDAARQVRAAGGTFGVFQSNHDLAAARPATLFNGQGPRMYLAAALTVLGPGMPIVYYGNEVGMPGAMASDSQMRRPFDWSAEAVLEALPDSLWRWHQTIIHLRTGAVAFRDPTLLPLAPVSDPGVLAYRVSSAGKSVVVVANLAASSVSFTVPVGATSTVRTILGSPGDAVSNGTLSVAALPGFGVRVLAEDDPSATVYLDHDPTPIDIALAPPPLPSLYLRGTFNGWDTSKPMSQAGGLFTAALSLSTSSAVAFKFGTADWGEAYGFDGLNYDGARATGTVPSSALTDEGAPYHNVSFAPPAAATYTFTFDYQAKTYWVR